MASDPTVVLLPGLDGTGVLFSPLLSVLPRDLKTRVVTYPRDPTLSMEGHARVAMAALPTGPAVLVAESFSGRVALSILAQGDPRVVGLVLVAAFAKPPWPARVLSRLGPVIGLAARRAPGLALRRYALGDDAPLELVSLFRTAVSSVPGTVLAHRLRLLATPPQVPDRAFEVPCLYLQASQDRLIPAAAPQSLRPWFRSIPVEVIAGPHFHLQARPQACSAAILAFLDRLAAPLPGPLPRGDP